MFKHIFKFSLLISLTSLIFLILFFSCSQDKGEKTQEAIDSAKVYLNKLKCDLAITALEDVGRDKKHAKYLQTLASAYACKSGYTAPIFYGANLNKIVATRTGFLGSLTKFTTSLMTDPEDAYYLNLKTAIEILMYAGDVSVPTTAERLKVFSQQESDDINIQLIYMVLTQLGKYVFYYGNADPTNGIKGSGTEANGNPNHLTNGCFYNYNPVSAIIKLAIDNDRANSALPLGSCTTTATGHPKLQPIPNANTIKRMCEGVVLFNLFSDLISNTTIPSGAGDLGNINTTFSSVCSGNSLAAELCTIRTQSSCETNYAIPPESDKLEAYFYLVYETLFI
ncbi:MAG: hypothetical protein HQK51_12815 [Oligoflexia bacterium]|nr:hypothetical protein [Oligoflexia bacterium]